MIGRWLGPVASVMMLLAVSACQKDETVAGYGATDKLWRLIEMDGAAVDYTATLTFPQAGQIAGAAPCNSYSATMTVPYTWFGVDALTATRRACPELASETAFFAALSDMTLSEVLGNTLILSTDDGREMVFNADG